MRVLLIDKREARALIAALLWASCGYRLGKAQISVLDKIAVLWPDLKEDAEIAKG